MSKSLALFAFHVLKSELRSVTHARLAEFEKITGSKTAEYPRNAPLFVTWNKDGELRGCIGTFSSSPTDSAVAQYAIISAFEDTRFRPIKQSELPSLSVSITLLDNFTEILDPEDWKIGVHGLKLLYKEGARYLGTFLPLVAEEQEWDHVETLWHLLKKAGISGVALKDTMKFYKSAIKAGTMKLVRYEGLKCAATYQEYVDAARSTGGSRENFSF